MGVLHVITFHPIDLSANFYRDAQKLVTAASAPAPETVESGSCPASEGPRPRSRRRSISPNKLPEIASHMLMHREILQKEFEELNAISAEWASKVTCNVGRMKQNKMKNRYADVIPCKCIRISSI